MRSLGRYTPVVGMKVRVSTRVWKTYGALTKNRLYTVVKVIPMDLSIGHYDGVAITVLDMVTGTQGEYYASRFEPLTCEKKEEEMR